MLKRCIFENKCAGRSAKVKRINIAITAEKAEELARIAKKKGESQATIMRLALDMLLKKEMKK